MGERDVMEVQVHDGIVGLMYLASVLLANQIALNWSYVAVGLALLQIASPFTRFCPVYTILNRVMPDTKPIQNGKA